MAKKKTVQMGGVYTDGKTAVHAFDVTEWPHGEVSVDYQRLNDSKAMAEEATGEEFLAMYPYRCEIAIDMAEVGEDGE